MTSPQCLSCDARRSDWPFGWIDEKYATLGGGVIRVTLCFPCRRLVVPFGGSDRCDGRCDGECDSAMAWVGHCRTCLDAMGDEASGEEWPLPTEPAEWSCFEEHCVRAWATQLHPDCDTDITHGARPGATHEHEIGAAA